jgi:hypothetical protein
MIAATQLLLPTPPRTYGLFVMQPSAKQGRNNGAIQNRMG